MEGNKKIEDFAKTAGAIFIENHKGEIVQCATANFKRNDDLEAYETDIHFIKDEQKRQFISDMHEVIMPRISGRIVDGLRASIHVHPSFEIPPYIVFNALDMLARRCARRDSAAEPTIAVKPSKVAS